MGLPRVLIHFKPRLYGDVLLQVIKSWGQFEICDYSGPNGEGDHHFDVVIVSLNRNTHPPLDLPPELQYRETKLLAISPQGEYALRRQAGKTEWEVLRPFSVSQLRAELAVE